MRWVSLDRDGVINHDSDAYIKSPEEWLPISGSLEAIAQLNLNGYRVVVVTNQAGVGRGLYDLATLERIHAKMRKRVEEAGGHIEAIYFCPHGPEEGCHCRKPQTGMYEQFANQYNVDLDGIPAVGDSLKDIQAAQSVGAQAILVETGNGKKTLQRNPKLDVPTFVNLHEAAQYILFTQS
jgi:D-glycero-D-manno-heptose 1,7-bisphosphate phosphatase